MYRKDVKDVQENKRDIRKVKEYRKSAKDIQEG